MGQRHITTETLIQALLDELGDQLVPILGVGNDGPFGNFAATRHGCFTSEWDERRLGLGPLDAILGALAIAVLLVGGAGANGTGGIEGAANDVVPNARKVARGPSIAIK